MDYANIVAWAKKVLNQTEIQPAVIAETPWSSVLKISTETDLGALYLKQTPPDLFVEVNIVQNCRALCGITDIPEIVAINKTLHCFLMTDCGEASLRTVLNGRLNIDLLIQGLRIYRNMQQATMTQVDAFLKAGAPDWRLARFPTLYRDLVSDEAFLKENPLEAGQIKILQNATPKVEALCQALSRYGISECLNHSDFHDNNMVYSKAMKKVCIIDLGETAINHPLFSLAAFLKAICNIYNLSPDSTDYKKLHDVCYQGWLDEKNSMPKVIELINALLPVYLIFTQKRFLDAIDLPYNADNPMSVKQHDKIYKGFIWFIENMRANS